MPAEPPFDEQESGYEGVGEFYDLFADNTDIPFFLEYARRTGSPILDLAAGTGRVTFALAQEGIDVVALEQSQSMLAVAYDKLRKSPEDVASRVKLVQGSMHKFSLDQKFALIMIPNSFGHLLTTEDQLSAIHCVRDHLLNGGRFILDLYPGAQQYEHATFEDAPAKLPDGRIVSRSGTIQSDFRTQLMRVELRYMVKDADGQVLNTIDVVSRVALIFNREADLLVRMSGMHNEDEFGDFEKNPYNPDSGRRIFVLRK
jgi:SAM-dependent methyltransferase